MGGEFDSGFQKIQIPLGLLAPPPSHPGANHWKEHEIHAIVSMHDVTPMSFPKDIADYSIVYHENTTFLNWFLAFLNKKGSL